MLILSLVAVYGLLAIVSGAPFESSETFSAHLGHAAPVNGTRGIHSSDSDIRGASSSFRLPLKKRVDQSRTVNELVSDVAPCKDLSVIFARDALEDGNLGAVVGIPLKKQLDKWFGRHNVAYQGLNYHASSKDQVNGFSTEGEIELRRVIRRTMRKCRRTQFLVAGYGLGAQVVRRGIKEMNEKEVLVIKGAALFGDPDRKHGVKDLPPLPINRIWAHCKWTDPMCRKFTPLPFGHFAYHEDADNAVRFFGKKIENPKVVGSAYSEGQETGITHGPDFDTKYLGVEWE